MMTEWCNCRHAVLCPDGATRCDLTWNFAKQKCEYQEGSGRRVFSSKEKVILPKEKGKKVGKVKATTSTINESFQGKTIRKKEISKEQMTMF